jgi:hypothetical protein
MPSPIVMAEARDAGRAAQRIVAIARRVIAGLAG